MKGNVQQHVSHHVNNSVRTTAPIRVQQTAVQDAHHHVLTVVRVIARRIVQMAAKVKQMQ